MFGTADNADDDALDEYLASEMLNRSMSIVNETVANQCPKFRKHPVDILGKRKRIQGKNSSLYHGRRTSTDKHVVIKVTPSAFSKVIKGGCDKKRK